MTNERVIKASDGMMLTNGEVFASSVRLGDWDSADNWHEVTMEEYENILQEQLREEGGLEYGDRYDDI